MKYSKRDSFIRVLCGLVLMGAFAGNVQAGLINGELSYSFQLIPEDGSGNATTLGVATFLNFGDGTVANDNIGVVTGVAGDFTGFIALFSIVTLSDFEINPFTNPTDVWNAGGFDFDLTSLTIVSQDNVFLSLTGSGVATGNGFDPTPGVWTLSVDNTGSIFAFSSTTNVPEPGILALFGLGLLGIGVMRRRR